ncbi:MAG: methyltransferase [Pseudomonadota bacterium]
MSEPSEPGSGHEVVEDDALFQDILFGLFGYQAFMVALELDLFSALAKTPLAVAALAEQLGLARNSAEALVMVCLSLKLLQRTDELLTLTKKSEVYLLPDSPLYIGDFLKNVAIRQSESTSYPCVRAALRGEASHLQKSEALFESHEKEAERAQRFAHSMHGHSMASAMQWPSKVDLGDVRHMVDVGGGSGAHAIGAALHWPQLTVSVLELPALTPVVGHYAAAYGVADRVRAVARDFWHDPLPPGDLHFFGDIFHDWPNDKAAALMRKSFDALRPGGRLIIHEILYHDDRAGPLAAAGLSVAMLVWFEGKQRSGSEYEGMLRSVGFRDIEAQPVFGYWSIVTAHKLG